LKQRQHIIIAAITILTGVLLAGCKATVATGSRAGVEPFFKSSEGLALKGYDPVAYFADGRPVEGRGEFEADWRGAKWRFASAEHRAAFLREPDKYAPQYGGYCSWAVGHAYTAKGDPEAWKIVDGKLYLNYDKQVREKWEREIAALIAKGDENWLAFQTAKPEHKGEGSN
jgi:YHS domain-containing protein